MTVTCHEIPMLPFPATMPPAALVASRKKARASPSPFRQLTAMSAELAFGDFPPGEVVEYGGLDVSADDIVAFAREFDPQPFHIDEEAARATTGGLIASGWHTCALLLRMNCDAFLMRAAILAEVGVEEKMGAAGPAGRPAAMCAACTLAARPRDGATDEGEVEFLYEVVNQDGLVAMTQRSFLVVKRARKEAKGE